MHARQLKRIVETQFSTTYAAAKPLSSKVAGLTQPFKIKAVK